MTDDVRPLDAEVIEHLGHVTGNGQQGVVVDAFGTIGVAETPQVGGNRAEPGRSEVGDLVAPEAM